MAWVTLILGDKHDYLIIIMLPNICNVFWPALLPSIFNDLLTQWAKETSNSTTKEVHQWPLMAEYQGENYNNTICKMQNPFFEYVLFVFMFWLYAVLRNGSCRRKALVTFHERSLQSTTATKRMGMEGASDCYPPPIMISIITLTTSWT